MCSDGSLSVGAKILCVFSMALALYNRRITEGKVVQFKDRLLKK